MKKILALAALLAAFACSSGSADPEDPTPSEQPGTGQPSTPAIEPPAFALGADISWASEMSASGRKFQKADGTEAPLVDVLKEAGANAIRLRVWVSPYKGWSGKEDVLAVSKAASKAGLALMIDFHYSDFFADPTRQIIPADWKADQSNLDKICSHVAEHTSDVLKALKEAGVTVNWVQIGNETRSGMIYPAGALDFSASGKQFASFLKLYNAGYAAAKEVYPEALVMFHLNNAYDSSNNNWWISNFKSQGGKFDAIALSHYPQLESDFTPQEYNAKALANIKSLYSTYKVPVYVAEVGVTSSGAEYLKAFMTGVRAISGCKGVFYWEPEVDGTWKPEIYGNVTQLRKYSGQSETGTWSPWDEGAFTSAGRPSAIFEAFCAE